MGISRYLGLLLLASFVSSTSAKADNARLQKIKPWDVQLIDNGYNFLVGISEDVPMDKAPQLLKKLQTAIKKASKTLYDLTGKRSSFGDVTVVIPNSWDKLGYPLADGESVDKGNLYVFTDPNEVEPFTLKYFKGSQSDRGSRSVLLHDEFIIKNGDATDIGEKIIEQWLSLRFGLDMELSKFANDIEQTNDCAEGSQNSVCEGLHSEITDWGKSVARPSPEPNIVIVRQRTKRIVVVLDVSGSMAFRMTKARQGIIRYFEHLYDLTLDDAKKASTLVAAVKFSTNATALGNLSSVISDDFDGLGTRISLLKAEQKTSIGAGLLQAISILENSAEGKKGAELILISDGVEDTKPFMNETWDEILNSKVVVHTIGFSNNADSRVDALGAATGGLTFIHHDGDSGNDLEQAFLSISDYENSDPAASGVVIFSNRLNVTTSDESYDVFVDALLTKNLTFLFECTLQNCINSLFVSFESPDKRKMEITSSSISGDFKDSEYVADRNLSRIAAEWKIIFLNAEAGVWKITTKRVFGLGTTILAFPNNPGQYPILAFCFWGIDRIVPNQTKGTQTMNALVSRGNNPVTGANVTAIVESGGKTLNFTLKDDGKGADLFANDGIYSASFLKKYFNKTSDQRYSMKMLLDGTATTKVRTRQLVAVSPARSRVAGLGSGDEPVDNLQRIALGGTFMSLRQENTQTIPDPIIDLKANIRDHKNGAVILTWTAPYDPFYSPSKRYGNRYKIYYGYSKEGLVTDPKDFDGGLFVVDHGTLIASEEGTNEKLAFVAIYSGYEHTMYFTIKSFRKMGRNREVWSEESNFVRVTFIRGCNPACRRGKCVEGISSCQCDPGFKGKLCEK